VTVLRGETLTQLRHRINAAKLNNVRELESIQTEALVEILVELRAIRVALTPEPVA
jgi:hypothetical protein